jgi:O-antigen ligase
VIATWPRTGDRARALGRGRAHNVPAYVLVPVCLGIAMLPLLQPAGPGNSSPVDVFFAVAIGATILWAGYAGQELRLPYALAVGLLMLGGAIGALAGPFPELGLLALVQDFVLLIWCGVVVNTARSPIALQWILRAWAWSAIAWAIVLVLAVASGNYALAGITDRTGVRAALTFGDPNYAANYFFVSLMIVMAARIPRRLGLRIAAAALLIVALGLTGSNGGILATAIGVGVVFLFYVGRRWGPMGAVAAGGFAAAGAVIALLVFQALPLEVWARDSGIPLLRDSVGRSSQSAQERAWLIQEMTTLYQQGAPWGLGPGSTKPLLQTELAPYAYQTHDDYLESIVERGFIGAFGLLVLIGAVGVRTWAVVARPLAPEFAALFPRTSPLVGAVVGLAVSASYYQILHFRHVWTLLAIIAALFVWARRRA